MRMMRKVLCAIMVLELILIMGKVVVVGLERAGLGAGSRWSA